MHSLLVAAGFRPSSTTTTYASCARQYAGTPVARLSIVWRPSTRSLLPSLLTTYYATWPSDYYRGDDTASIADIFRQARSDDLYLALAANGEVAGYVLASRTPELGVIDEVAVHPAHRRQGLGEALVLKAMQSLGDRRISLVVMDDNPAQRLYERLGFALWEDRVDLDSRYTLVSA